MSRTNKPSRAVALSMGLLLVFSLLAGVCPASAGEPAGSGPDSAQRPSGDWSTLQPGASTWYAFEYAGDSSQVTIRLQAEPRDSLAFGVWTPGNVRDWRLGLEAEPVGRGSPDPGSPGRLAWSGSFTEAGTYYVVVEGQGGQAETSYYLLEIEGTGVTLSAPAPTPAPTPRAQPAGSGSRPAAAPPAGRLAFQTSMGGPIYVINADGSGLRRLTDGMDPTWSPDGREIAFARWREPRGIWVISADGSNEWRAFDWDEARWPSWSPDGSQILFSRQYGGRTEETERCFWGFCFTMPAHPHWKLGIVRTASGEFREPKAPNYCLAPTWSPILDDGSSRLLYADEQGLKIQNEDASVAYFITRDSRDTSPVWSPDGSRVAFTRRQHDHWEVYVADADGRNPSRLTDTPVRADGELGNSAAPAWSPDGQYLAFLTDRSGRWEIWIMGADGSQEKPMFPGGLKGISLDYASLGERAISWTK